jgi:hypothetical protein
MTGFKRSEATGTHRDHLIEDQGLGDLFADLPPEQKALGLLMGKILNKDTRSFDQIEEAFSWYEKEKNGGIQLGYPQKIMVLIQVTGMLGGDQRIYNLIRKMYLTVANRS